VKAGTYDIVLMDIQMPIMDGYDATKEIRKDLDSAELPIIAMTANALLSDQEKCIQAGMNDHVAKPIDTAQLFQKIAHWTKKKPGTIPEKALLDAPALSPSANEALANNIGTIPNFPGIDTQTGLSRLGGNQKLYRQLLVKFHKNHQHAIIEIRHALDHGDMKAAELLVHTIKGAAGNLGIQDAYVSASALEAELRGKGPDSAELLIKQLEQALEQAFASISLSEKTPDDVKSSNPGGADMSQLTPMLNDLKYLLLDNNMDALECVEEIVSQAKNTAFAEKTSNMKDYADQYDFKGALGILDELLNHSGQVLEDGK
jgi:two-component system sensor histidine kinase/response regulator